MKQLRIWDIAQSEIETYLAGNDPTLAWPETKVLLAVTLAPMVVNKERMSTIAALALNTLPIDRRVALMAEYDVPGIVISKMDQNLSWPDPLPVAVAQLDIAAYKDRRLVDLNLLAEAQAHRVIWGGDRLSQTYPRKEAQARVVLADADPENMAVDTIRYIAAEATALGITRVQMATAVLEQATAWEIWDAEIVEPTRQVAQAQILAAQTVEEVNQAYEAAEALIVGGMDVVISSGI